MFYSNLGHSRLRQNLINAYSPAPQPVTIDATAINGLLKAEELGLLDNSTNDIEKGRKAMPIGSHATWAGVSYLKTATGWKPVGKLRGTVKENHDLIHNNEEKDKDHHSMVMDAGKMSADEWTKKHGSNLHEKYKQVHDYLHKEKVAEPSLSSEELESINRNIKHFTDKYDAEIASGAKTVEGIISETKGLIEENNKDKKAFGYQKKQHLLDGMLKHFEGKEKQPESKEEEIKPEEKKEESISTDTIPSIVKRAMTETVTDIGQLSDEDKKHLNKYVKDGVLISGKGGSFPKEKTVYAIKGFDIQADRHKQMKEMLDTAEKMDRATGMGKLWDKKESKPTTDNIPEIVKEKFKTVSTDSNFSFMRLQGKMWRRDNKDGKIIMYDDKPQQDFTLPKGEEKKPDYTEAIKLPKDGAVAMDKVNMQAQSAEMIAKKHALQPKAVYNWAQKHDVDLTKYGHILSNTKNNPELTGDILNDRFHHVKELLFKKPESKPAAEEKKEGKIENTAFFTSMKKQAKLETSDNVVQYLNTNIKSNNGHIEEANKKLKSKGLHPTWKEHHERTISDKIKENADYEKMISYFKNEQKSA